MTVILYTIYKQIITRGYNHNAQKISYEEWKLNILNLHQIYDMKKIVNLYLLYKYDFVKYKYQGQKIYFTQDVFENVMKKINEPRVIQIYIIIQPIQDEIYQKSLQLQKLYNLKCTHIKCHKVIEQIIFASIQNSSDYYCETCKKMNNFLCFQIKSCQRRKIKFWKDFVAQTKKLKNCLSEEEIYSKIIRTKIQNSVQKIYWSKLKKLQSQNQKKIKNTQSQSQIFFLLSQTKIKNLSMLYQSTQASKSLNTFQGQMLNEALINFIKWSDSEPTIISEKRALLEIIKNTKNQQLAIHDYQNLLKKLNQVVGGNNVKYQEIIQQLLNKKKTVLELYTKYKQIYKFVNMMLKIHYNNQFILPYSRFLISKIYTEIQQNYKNRITQKNKDYLEKFKVYRGCLLNEEQLITFKKNKGKIFQSLSFLSCSFDQQQTKQFLEMSQGNTLVIVKKNKNKSGIIGEGFYNFDKDQKHQSQYYQERQVLFNINNKFKILDVYKFPKRQLNQKKLYCLKLQLIEFPSQINKASIQLYKKTVSLKSEQFKLLQTMHHLQLLSTGIQSQGDYFFIMKKFKEAKQYYICMIQQYKQNDLLAQTPKLYRKLGIIYKHTGQKYRQSLMYMIADSLSKLNQKNFAEKASILKQKGSYYIPQYLPLKIRHEQIVRDQLTKIFLSVNLKKTKQLLNDKVEKYKHLNNKFQSIFYDVLFQGILPGMQTIQKQLIQENKSKKQSIYQSFLAKAIIGFGNKFTDLLVSNENSQNPQYEMLKIFNKILLKFGFALSQLVFFGKISSQFKLNVMKELQKSIEKKSKQLKTSNDYLPLLFINIILLVFQVLLGNEPELCIKEQTFQENQQDLRRSIQIFEQLIKKNDKYLNDYFQAKRNIGYLYAFKGHKEKSVEIFQKLIEQVKEKIGQKNLILSNIYDAYVFVLQKRYNILSSKKQIKQNHQHLQKLKYFVQKSYVIKKELLGQDHIQICVSENNRVFCQSLQSSQFKKKQKQQNINKCIESLNNITKILEKHTQNIHKPLLAKTYQNMRGLYLQKNQKKEAHHYHYLKQKFQYNGLIIKNELIQEVSTFIQYFQSYQNMIKGQKQFIDLFPTKVIKQFVKNQKFRIQLGQHLFSNDFIDQSNLSTFQGIKKNTFWFTKIWDIIKQNCSQSFCHKLQKQFSGQPDIHSQILKIGLSFFKN